MRARERQGAVRELGGKRGRHVAELGQVGRVEVDDEAVRGEGPVRRRQTFGLHRALDPPLELDRLHARAEETSRRALKQSFEEPLDGGERRHGRWRSLPEGPEMPRRTESTLTFGAFGRYTRRRGPLERGVYSRTARTRRAGSGVIR